jgi:hypothetical protein
VELQLKLRLTNAALSLAAPKSSKRGPLFHARVSLLVMLSDGQLLHHASLSLFALAKGEHAVRVPVTGLINSAQTVQVSVVSENVVGVGLTRTVVPDVAELAFKNARKRAPAGKGGWGGEAGEGGRGKVARLALTAPEGPPSTVQATSTSAAVAVAVVDEDAEFDAFFDCDAGEVACIEAAALAEAQVLTSVPVPASRPSPPPRTATRAKPKDPKPLSKRGPLPIVSLVPATPDMDLIHGFGYTPGGASAQHLQGPGARSPTILLDSSSSDSGDDALHLLPNYAPRLAATARVTSRVPLVREPSVEDFDLVPVPARRREPVAHAPAKPTPPTAPAPAPVHGARAPLAVTKSALPCLPVCQPEAEAMKRRVSSAIQDALADFF